MSKLINLSNIVEAWTFNPMKIELARMIEADVDGRFVPLPGRFENHEWEMMNCVARRLDDVEASEALLNTIHGRGAFRYFKDKVRELELVDRWHAYRDEQYRQIARGWCEANGIEYINE